MRTGPHPLSLHLGLAGAALKNNDDRQGSLAVMVRGIQRYQKNKISAQHEKRTLFCKVNTVVVTRIHQVSSVSSFTHCDDNEICLLIPSLINRSSIMDLDKRHSFAQWMADQGIDTYLLDWGDLTQDQDAPDISDLITKRLVPVLEKLHARTGKIIHVVGYCMGGTLSVALGMKAKSMIASLTLLATPWNYHAGREILHKRVQLWAPSAFAMLEKKDFLPVEWMQTLFASLDPEMVLKKYTNFANLEEGADSERLFVLVEDWLNDGTPLPEKVARECIESWFLNNDLFKGSWSVDGENIRPEALECPVLVMCSSKDRLVEHACSFALCEGLKHAKYIDPKCGHLGMMIGKERENSVWHKVYDHICDHTA